MNFAMNLDEEALRIIEAASRTPYLTPEQERSLVLALKAGGKAGEAAQATLLAAHQRLVINCAKRFSRCGKPMSDLIQEGNVGLVRAAKKFDPNVGVRFSTYAIWWVREAIKQLAYASSGAVYLPLKQIKEIARMERTIRQLSTNGEQPPDHLVAKTMGVTMSRLHQLKKLAQPAASMNAKLNGESDTEFGDMLADPTCEDLDEAIDQKRLAGQLSQALAGLGERDRDILVRRFGLGCKKETLEDLAQRYNLTRERIRQLEARALQKLAQGKHARLLKQFI